MRTSESVNKQQASNGTGRFLETVKCNAICCELIHLIFSVYYCALSAFERYLSVKLKSHAIKFTLTNYSIVL